MSLLPASLPTPHRLATALAAALSTLPLAALAHDPTDLDAVQVTASPLAGDAESLARPVEVLAGDALDRAKGATLGETVARLPGVQSSYFGPGVGRPILRGLDGPRVQVLAGGLGVMDASTVSADHAASVEPFLADQIEVLKGPATLLFGSGAIGGAVNVADGRIALYRPDEPLSGRAEKPFSARWITSAPASVSCNWITSTSSGPMPASSNAARDASTVGPGVCSIGSQGLCTSNAPSCRVRTVVARRYTGVSV